ncbi:cobalamin B12-binding domain-containing protein [Methanobacterium alcaliphilum]|uniref:cobalamin B12-binding domain-containing protein n=1 Tax=Methanobacterium alcaliphilum TaxID=392018 RepID=UPI00200B8658|nr:cobalamin-dependent protein [Methanobacterium alcaliphilum]MCK9151732.1 cobalamin-dependent protein [Methanobacterium alcaliphilum]
MDKFQEESGYLTKLAKNYLNALLNVDRHRASKMIHDAVNKGISLTDIYLHVFEASQHEIGRLWQKNRINVAQEHYCTAVTQQIMSELYPLIFNTPKNGHMIIASCAAEEMHEIGVRMVADIFELNGWDSYYLGANTPSSSILESISQLKPDLIAISCSIHYNIPSVIDLISKIKVIPERDDLIIMVGGRSFSTAPELWRKVGADTYAPNALEAVKKANQLIKS